MDSTSAAKNESQNEAFGEDPTAARHHDGNDGEAVGRVVDDFACPVCGARQALSESCRRCRADLSLVVGVYSEIATKRARCLALVRQRRLLRATRLAKECLELSRDEFNRRLLATCYLLQGDFAAALRIRTCGIGK